MANRSKRNAQRRMRIVMTVFALLVILSMVVSMVATLSGPTVTQPQPTSAPPTIVLTLAP